MLSSKIVVRLERVGCYRSALYNVVVTKGSKKQHTKFYSKIGLYLPLSSSRFFFVNMKELGFWLSRGAVVKGRLAKLILSLMRFY